MADEEGINSKSKSKSNAVPMAVDDDNMSAPATQKKKISLKRSKKKKDLNISKGNLKSVSSTNKSFSFLNMSVQKQTLRANNKALAQNLAKTRQELRQQSQQFQDLQTQNQELKLEVCRLRRIAGIKDGEIEEEVQKRIAQTMQDMKTLCEDLTQSMLQSSRYITSIHDKCIVYCRRSTDSTRNSSIGGELSDGESAKSQNSQLNTRRNVFGTASDSALSSILKSKIGGFGVMAANSQLGSSNDMSIIAEQSILDVDDVEMPQRTPLETVKEDVVSQGNSFMKKTAVNALPQRIPVASAKQQSVSKAVKTTETSKIPITKPSNGQDTQTDKGEKVSMEVDKLGGESKTKPSEKSKSNKSTKSVTKPSLASQTSKQGMDVGLLEEADVSAFGFGGDFAKDLVSGSPISGTQASKTPTLDGTKPAQPEKKSTEDKKVRRETFVMPKPPVKRDTVKEIPVEKSGDKISKEKTKSNKRQTYATENPSINKTSKVIRSPTKNHLDTHSYDYESVSNPFKPSNTLLRSPVGVKNASEESKETCDKVDSRAFLAKFKHSLDAISAETSPLPEPAFQDEPTTYFNTDMEFTAVIDTASFLKGISSTNKDGPNIPVVTVEQPSPVPEDASKNEKKKSKTTSRSKAKEGKENESKKVEEGKLSKSETQEDKQAEDFASVEVRTKKPGVFTFSVSRKDADGTRKPVPEQASKARSKKKPATTKAVEEELRKDGEDRDTFNFGDRTPTMPLEKMPKSLTHNVYDLSMTEGGQKEQTCMKNTKDKQDNKPVKLPDPRPKEGIYYMPLKDSVDDEPAPKQSRSKSKTRSKSKNRGSDSEDDDWVPGGRSKSRARSRGRSVSKKTEDSDSKQAARTTRGRSKSCPRKEYIEINSDENDESVVEPVSRKRSRSRARKILDDEGEEDSVPKVRRGRSQSRRRTIKNSDEDLQDDESGDTNKSENDSEKTDRSRKSRTRDRKSVKSCTDVDSMDNVQQDQDDRASQSCEEDFKSGQGSRSKRQKKDHEKTEADTIKPFGAMNSDGKTSDSEVSSKTDHESVEKTFCVPESDTESNSKDRVTKRKSTRKSHRAVLSDPSESEETITARGYNTEDKTGDKTVEEDNLPEGGKSLENVLAADSNVSRRGRSSRYHNYNDIDIEVLDDEDDKKKSKGKSLKEVTKSSKKSVKKRADKKESECKEEKKSKAKIFQDNEGIENPNEKADSLPAKTPAAGTAVRKEKKSVKTTGRTAQKRKAMDDVTKDQTPKAKKDNSVKMETAENQVEEDRLAMLKRRLTMMNCKRQNPDDKEAVETPNDKQVQDQNLVDQNEDDGSDGRRQRRNKNPVSYKPKPLNVKLRQGDQMFENPANAAKAKAEQLRLTLARKTLIPKVSREDQENIPVT